MLINWSQYVNSAFQSRNVFYPCLRPDHNILVGSFALRAFNEPESWRVTCCLTLADVFQVHIRKASKGNCNSHLPFCFLLDKQEKYNNNNGGESSLSRFFKSESCCGLNDAWNNSWMLSSAEECQTLFNFQPKAATFRLLRMILGTYAPFTCSWKLFWRVPLTQVEKFSRSCTGAGGPMLKNAPWPCVCPCTLSSVSQGQRRTLQLSWMEL